MLAAMEQDGDEKDEIHMSLLGKRDMQRLERFHLEVGKGRDGRRGEVQEERLQEQYVQSEGQEGER